MARDQDGLIFQEGDIFNGEVVAGQVPFVSGLEALAATVLPGLPEIGCDASNVVHQQSLVSLVSLMSFKGAAFRGWLIRKCPAVSSVGPSGEVEFRGRSGRLLRTASASARIIENLCGTQLSW